VITAAALIACLLTHELGHTSVARAAGIEVEGITLWMFGGMSRLKGEAPDATTEQRMALAGPVVSLELGLALIGVGIVLEAVGAPQATVAAATWLGVMNGVLAVFNLLPAYPLDGGRALRAMVWRRTGEGAPRSRWSTPTGHPWASSR
jgi:Zn-dependent protease